MGYLIAWERRRALLSVLALVLVPTSLIQLALRLLVAPDQASVLNGELVVPALDGWPGFADTAIMIGSWLLGITAAILVIGPPSHGTGEALKRAAKLLPAQAACVLLAIAVTALFTLFAGAAGWIGIVPLVALAFVLARLSTLMASTALGGERALGGSPRILMGAVVLPLLALAAADLAGRRLLEVQPSPVTGFAVHALGTLLVIAVVAVQAGTILAVYLDLRDGLVSETVPPPRDGRLWMAAAALLLPAAALAVITPAHEPQILVRQGVLSSPGEEIAVAEGHPPVIFTQTGAYRCDDLACSSGTEDISVPNAFQDTAVGVGADGAILTAMWSRDGKDFVEVTRCAPKCEDFGKVPVMDDAALKPLPLFGIGAGADGTVWIAVAKQPTPEHELELSLIRCAPTGCQDHKRIPAGRFAGPSLSRGEWEGDRYPVRVRMTPDGTPTAEFGFDELVVITCDSPACTTANVTRRPNPANEPMMFSGSLKAMVVNDLGAFMVTTEKAPPESGVHLRIGAPAPQRERVVLWQCDQLARCADGRRIPLHIRPTPPPNLISGVHLVVLPDGTVLITEGATIVSLKV